MAIYELTVQKKKNKPLYTIMAIGDTPGDARNKVLTFCKALNIQDEVKTIKENEFKINYQRGMLIIGMVKDIISLDFDNEVFFIKNARGGAINQMYNSRVKLTKQEKSKYDVALRTLCCARNDELSIDSTDLYSYTKKDVLEEVVGLFNDLESAFTLHEKLSELAKMVTIKPSKE